MAKSAGRRGARNPNKNDKDGAVDSGASSGGTGNTTPSGDRGAVGDGAGGYPPPVPPTGR